LGVGLFTVTVGTATGAVTVKERVTE